VSLFSTPRADPGPALERRALTWEDAMRQLRERYVQP
jgi:hypothetical protein